MIEGLSSPFALDRNSSVGIMLFVREEILSKLLSEYKVNSSVENIFIKINLRSKTQLLSCSCNSNLTLLNDHIQNISMAWTFICQNTTILLFWGILILKLSTIIF